MLPREDIEPNETGTLAVGNGHEIYWETWGNPDGLPVVFLHGGPGGGFGPRHRRLFDPERFHVVFHDQRGCGRSTPTASDEVAALEANTTQHLIADIESLRRALGIEDWIVYGLSWGATLGLAYAESHPDDVTGIMLGVFGFGNEKHVRWITEGVAPVFAPQWERFSSFVPEPLRDQPIVSTYAALLVDEDPDVRRQAALEWCAWEDAHMSLATDGAPGLEVADPDFQLGFARLVTHYWSNASFLGEDQLLAQATRLAGIPGQIVQGRYDISTPIEMAWRLSRVWDAELTVIEGGHASSALGDGFTAALDRLADQIR